MNRIVLAALFAGVASSAFAADLPTRKGPPAAPALAYALPFSWSGLYVGVNGGWGFGSLSNTNLPSPSGGMLGGTLGYNQQFGQIVAGVEADLDATDSVNNNSYVNGVNKFSTGALTTERARIGFAMDRALLFATAGYAGMGTTASFNDTVNGVSGWQQSWRNGAAVGGGVEYAFTNNISAKAEYLYLPFSDQTYFAGTPDAEKNSLSVNLIRAGLNYKF